MTSDRPLSRILSNVIFRDKIISDSPMSVGLPNLVKMCPTMAKVLAFEDFQYGDFDINLSIVKSKI